jgi:hypothetical protein
VDEGLTPAHFAASGGKVDTLEWLCDEVKLNPLKAGGDSEDQTPLLVALRGGLDDNARATHGHFAVVRILVEKYKALNSAHLMTNPDSLGTHLYAAIRGQNVEILQYLMNFSLQRLCWLHSCE